MVLTIFSYCSSAKAATPVELTLRYQHHIFTFRPGNYPAWRSAREEWRYAGKPFRAPQSMRAEGDVPEALPYGVTRTTVSGWNIDGIAATLQTSVAGTLDRPAGSVAIRRDITGAVVFDGIGLPGRRVDVPAAAYLVAAALDRGLGTIELPVFEEQPHITVLDADLQRQGINEVVTVGESDFSGSPFARRHNIAVGLAKFNGHVIPSGTVFSFNAVLGPVNAATGYKKELVILGERTLPDYGGGLCQVSTTAYRGAWEYGLPIEARRNHSFAVRYYGPQGTDATVFPPYTDMRFRNDTPGALLLQTYAENSKAYFIYYGTRDSRRTAIYGPFTWGSMAPPPDRTEYTTEIAPGTTRKVGERVPGMRAAWFRVLERTTATGATTEVVEPFYSAYEARPLFTQIGVEPGSPLLQSSSSSNGIAGSSGISVSSMSRGAVRSRSPRRRN